MLHRNLESIVGIDSSLIVDDVASRRGYALFDGLRDVGAGGGHPPLPAENAPV